jgi:D-sedoheptulose 7-phosphate isomerase
LASTVTAALRQARGTGLLSIALAAGGPHVVDTPVDHLLTVPSEDPRIAKEVQVTLYHILWELVHIFFERPGALPAEGPATCITCSDQAQAFPVVSLLEGSLAMVDTGQGLEKVSVALVEACVGDRVLVHAGEAIALVPPGEGGPSCATGPVESPGEDLSALYPFLYDERDADSDAVLGDVARSTAAKAEEIALLRQQVGEAKAHRLAACASAMARAFASGGRLLAFGNGGSSSDAQAVAHTFLAPPAGERALPALSLTNDIAVVTALANDIGFEVVFARQVAAWGRPSDIAFALSTSGGSANVLAGLEEAKRAGMLTVGLAGYDGGKMAEAALDFLFVIPSSSVHRIQEAQTTVYHVLAELTQVALAGS